MAIASSVSSAETLKPSRAINRKFLFAFSRIQVHFGFGSAVFERRLHAVEG
jgi:hypothetical protein